MFLFQTRIHHSDGCSFSEGAVYEKHLGNTSAVYSDGKVTGTAIHPDLGLSIDLIPSQPIKQYTAIFRCTQYWCRPEFGTDLTAIPENTQALILALENGEFCTVVPVVNDTYKCTLEGTDRGITARVASWFEGLTDCHGLCFVYAIGKKPAQLLEACVSTALSLLNHGVKMRKERPYPEIMEYLGWCSWDSMQIRVNEAGILEKCQEFKDKNIPVKWAIFDDMWAYIRDFYGKEYHNFKELVSLIHSSMLYDLEADPIRFPQGLAHCIQKVHEMGMKVCMWSPVSGYWKGFDPEGPAYSAFKDTLILSNMGRWITNWQKDDAYRYFSHVLGFFKDSGADFVKIDQQSLIYTQYKGMAPVGQIAAELHQGLETAVAEKFDSVMINCMGMASESMWSRCDSPVSRCSDDFLPENKAWFTKHVLQCAYNSLLQGQFYWCDWDMWWTDDGQAKKNSLMRAISGGPIYVSDMLQRSRKEILEPLVLKDGRILRCDRPCMPTSDCAAEDPTTSGKALKLQNMAGSHGILAVLNLDANEQPVIAQISDEDIDGFDAEQYAVYEHFSQSLQILNRGEQFTVTLDSDRDYRLYIFAPIQNGFAAIGRIDKFISPKTIQSVSGTTVNLVEDGPYAYVQDSTLHIR